MCQLSSNILAKQFVATFHVITQEFATCNCGVLWILVLHNQSLTGEGLITQDYIVAPAVSADIPLSTSVPFT